MIQRRVLAFVALASLPFSAIAASQQPPPEYASHVAAMRKADAIQDPLQRCLAYPDLPGNTWTPGVAQARCTMFLSPLPYTLDDIAGLLDKDAGAATLDATFRQLLEAHYTVPAKREQITRLLDVFSDGDRAKAERTARRWTAVAPDSEFAQAALGHALGGDEESVCAALTLAASELSRLEEELRQRERETGRITAALCLGGGAMLCILLL